jgi:hypothetical protein
MSPQQTAPVACPYCLCAVEADDAPFVCPGCRYRYHGECYEKLGGCAVDGCEKAVEVKKAAIPHTHWGATTKKCPICAETIPVEAIKCPFCAAEFNDQRPLTREDVIPKLEDPEIAETRRKAKWLLIFSLIGCTSPFALFFGGVWYRNNTEEISRAGSSTRAMVLISLLICALYLVFAGLGTLVFSLKSNPS